MQADDVKDVFSPHVLLGLFFTIFNLVLVFRQFDFWLQSEWKFLFSGLVSSTIKPIKTASCATTYKLL